MLFSYWELFFAFYCTKVTSSLYFDCSCWLHRCLLIWTLQSWWYFFFIWINISWRSRFCSYFSFIFLLFDNKTIVGLLPKVTQFFHCFFFLVLRVKVSFSTLAYLIVTVKASTVHYKCSCSVVFRLFIHQSIRLYPGQLFELYFWNLLYFLMVFLLERLRKICLLDTSFILCF